MLVNELLDMKLRDVLDEYCFEGEHIIAWPMEVDFEAEVLELEGLRNVLDYLGIEKKEEGGT